MPTASHDPRLVFSTASRVPAGEEGCELPRMRIVVFEFNLMASHRIGEAVEDDEAGRRGPLVYATNEPLIWRKAIDGDVVSVNPWALALANLRHPLVIAPQTRRDSGILLFDRGFVVVEMITRQGGLILPARRRPGCVAGDECRDARDIRDGGRIYQGRSISTRDDG